MLPNLPPVTQSKCKVQRQRVRATKMAFPKSYVAPIQSNPRQSRAEARGRSRSHKRRERPVRVSVSCRYVGIDYDPREHSQPRWRNIPITPPKTLGYDPSCANPVHICILSLYSRRVTHIRNGRRDSGKGYRFHPSGVGLFASFRDVNMNLKTQSP